MDAIPRTWIFVGCVALCWIIQATVSENTVCSEYLVSGLDGMDDSKLTSSSIYANDTPGHGPLNARLHFAAGPNIASSAWVAGANDVHQYIQDVLIRHWIGLAVILVCPTIHSKGTVCYQGWSLGRHKCYKLFTALKSWEDAHAHCRRFNGGSLMLLNTQQRVSTLGDLATLSDRKYWIGGKYEINNWQWTDGGPMNRAGLNMSLHDQNKDRAGFCMAVENNMLVQVCCSDLLGFVCEANTIECMTKQGWVVTPMKHCIKLMNNSTNLTWPDARGTCKQEGADLATFSNSSEWQFIKYLVGNRNRNKIWLGLTYNTATNVYHWLDGRVADSDKTLVTTPQSHMTGTVCGGLNEINSRSTVKWFYSRCNRTLYFICEKASCKSNGDVFVCQDGQCVDQGVTCDGQNDCQDRSDEDTLLCSPTNDTYIASDFGISDQQHNIKQCSFAKTETTTISDINTIHMTASKSKPESTSSETHMATTYDVDPIHSFISKSIPDLHTSFPSMTRLTGSTSGTIFHDKPTLQYRPTTLAFHSSTPLMTLQSLSTFDDNLFVTTVNLPPLLDTGLLKITSASFSTSPTISAFSVSQTPPLHMEHFTLNYLSSLSHNDKESRSRVISPTPSVVTDSMAPTTDPTKPFTKHDPPPSFLQTSMTLLPSHHMLHAILPGNQFNNTMASTDRMLFTSTTIANTTTSYGSVTTSNDDVTTTNDDVTTSNVAITASNDDVITTQEATVVQCTKLLDHVSRKQCIRKYLPTDNLRRCNISNWAESVVHKFNATSMQSPFSEVDVLELTLDLMDMMLLDIQDDSLRGDDNMCLEYSLTDFEHLMDVTMRTLNTNTVGIHNTLIDLHIERVTISEIRKYMFRNNDTVVSDLEIASPLKRTDEAMVLSIMLITTSDNSNLQLRRSTTGEIDQKNLFLLSRVLSITGYLSTRPLSLSLTYTLRHTCDRMQEQAGANKSADIICGYIDKESGYWSDKGCHLLHTNTSASTCHCNHTTNFAILMQVQDVKITDLDQTVLSLITYIGCSVSLITQLITVTVFVCVGTLNSERVYVHRNLCFAIIASQVAFLSGIKAVGNKVLCSIVAMILHYFYTAMFVWMLVEGMHLYSKVVRVFSTERSRVIYYCGFGWGVPLVLVTISATADWEGYGNGKSCWLSTKTGTIWAFVGPAIAIILVNIVILAMVVRVVMSSAKLEKHGEFDHIRAGVKGALFLLPLLGLTWLFGLLAVNEDMIVFQYLFAIFNSLQGFFIFLFHCAFNLEVRQALSKMRERRMLQRGDFVSLSNGNSDGFQKTQHRHRFKTQKPYRKKRVSSVTSEQTTSWSPKHSSVSSRSSTQSTDVRETDDVVVQDLTLPEENFALQYI